jgi:GGDEF domain-containing protein
MMGITEARKYIDELHKKQDNPYLWPDFLTGLPDKSAIINKMAEIFPKLGQYSIAYVRIANIQPYLVKYGPDQHADIIQWAAAILKTTCDKCKDCFVGTLSTHDFIMICETKDLVKHMKEAGKFFAKKIESYYTKEDLKNNTTLSFKRDGKKVDIGLIRLVSVVADSKLHTQKANLLQDMGKVCEAMERTTEDIIVMTDDMICR